MLISFIIHLKMINKLIRFSAFSIRNPPKDEINKIKI